MLEADTGRALLVGTLPPNWASKAWKLLGLRRLKEPACCWGAAA